MNQSPSLDETATPVLKSETLAFLQKDYELKVRFLTDHYSRMWTRFNFFMVATTGLAIGLCQGLREGKSLEAGTPFLVSGFVLAFWWYVFGAQDRYLVEAYRAEIRRVADYLRAGLGLSQELSKVQAAGQGIFVVVGDVTQACGTSTLSMARRIFQYDEASCVVSIVCRTRLAGALHRRALGRLIAS
jgi:hypothetical protein